jgi:APA family basic amino acid/polyamine antiporter
MGSAIYVALGLVAIHGAGLTPAAVLAAGLVFAAVAACYAEGVSMFPEAGGAAAFARHAFNEFASFATGWAAGLAQIAVTAIAALFAAHYLSVFWTPLATSPWDIVGALVVIAAVAAITIRGLEQSASLGTFLGVVDIATQLLLVAVGAVFMFHPEVLANDVHLGTSPSFEQLLLAGAVAMMAYTGIETITHIADEAQDPDRDLPRALSGVLGSVVSLYLALALIAIMAMPVTRGASGRYTTLLAQDPPHGYAAYPMLGIASQLPLHVLSTGLRYFVGLLVASMLLVTALAAVASFARMSSWLSQHHELPGAIASVHPEYETAYVAAGCCTIAAAALVIAQAGIADGASFLAGTYVFGALLAFTSVQASVIAMRWRDPARYRPLEVPVNIPVDGRRLPVLGILGGVCTAAAWLAVLLLEPAPRYVGSVWMLVGIVGFVAYRRHLGLSLTELTQRDISQRTGPGIAVEFQTMLIPVNTDQPDIPADAVEVAARLAAERRASVVLLAFTEIPLAEEMDMEIDELDRKVEGMAARARAIGEQYGIRVHTTHLRTRDPAESILAEAARRNSQVILLGADGLHRTRFRRVAYDLVVRRIVAEAKQRVMIIQPAGASA